MTLWGNLDNATGNQKPLFANTSNATSASTIHGSKANTSKYYGNMLGISVTEQTNSAPALTGHPTHSGWVSQKIGTGPVSGISVVTPGQGVNTAGFILLTDNSVYGQGTGVNISYTIANTLNTLQASSSNSTLNGVATLTVVNGGSGWSNNTLLTAKITVTNTVQPTFGVTLGGRAGRVTYETIIATGSITGDDTRDDGYFPGS